MKVSHPFGSRGVLLVVLLFTACSGGTDRAGPVSPTRGPATTVTAAVTTTAEEAEASADPVVDSYEIPAGSGPHDVWAAPDGKGGVWIHHIILAPGFRGCCESLSAP